MKILILGANGMVGRGVLRECLAARDVMSIRTLGRTASGMRDPRLDEIVLANLFAIPEAVFAQLDGFDACFFCLGVSSSGMDERDYTRLTHDLTLAIAAPLAARNPGMTLVYVSGAGTDAASKTMWARVKGRTEMAIRALPFARCYALRPAVILPMNGERSGVRAYRLVYALAGPLLRVLRRIAPRQLLTTEIIGRAMLELARAGGPQPILEASDIHAVAVRDKEKGS